MGFVFADAPSEGVTGKEPGLLLWNIELAWLVVAFSVIGSLN